MVCHYSYCADRSVTSSLCFPNGLKYVEVSYETRSVNNKLKKNTQQQQGSHISSVY